MPSSARAATRRPSPSRPKPWWWCDLTAVLAEQPAEPRVLARSSTSWSAKIARHLLVLVVADELGQVLDEVAAARDVQELRAAADREHRQVAGERRLEQRELGVVASRDDPSVSGVRAPARRARVDVGAAREDEPVERVERLVDPLVDGGTSSAPPAGALDRADVVGGNERRLGVPRAERARVR